MTVNTDSNKIIYLGNGSTTTFTFPFSTPDASFIVVFTEDAQGVVTQRDPTSFTVTLNPLVGANPTASGGSVTLSGPPVPTGGRIAIGRVLPATQSVSLSNQSIVYPPVIEREFDYLTMLNQQRGEEASRAFVVPLGDPIPAPVPTVALRANLQAFFDSIGNLTAGSPPSGGVFISAAMIPVVQAATTALALALLGGAPLSLVENSVFTTGDLKLTHKTNADLGWIIWTDGTIGDGTSGAGIRANADTRALFAIYYNGYSDANCPLLTSTGLATTRAAQGSATTAYDAHCRVTLPRGAGRDLALAGAGAGLTARVLGSFNGAETVTPTLATSINHGHSIGAGTGAFYTNTAGGGLFGLQAGGDYSSYLPDGYNFLNNAIAVGGSQAYSIQDPRTYINVMVKL